MMRSSVEVWSFGRVGVRGGLRLVTDKTKNKKINRVLSTSCPAYDFTVNKPKANHEPHPPMAAWLINIKT